MPKYVALQDVPPSVKKGDIVTIKEPLVPSYKDKFAPHNPQAAEPAKDEDEDSDDGKTVVRNPDRNALKDRAIALGINFAQNIPTERLIELIQEAEDKQNAGGEGGSDVEQPEGGSGGPEGSGTDPDDGASEE